jgi:carotenoid cleavage dioxygenase
MEADMPYALKILCDGVLETIGIAKLEGTFSTPFTAHPKIDPEDGMLYGFGYKVCTACFPAHSLDDKRFLLDVSL